MKSTKTILAVLLTAAAVSFMPSAQACEEQVLGESLDSGLGELGPKYTAQEFIPVRVLGESLDSGLGELTRKDLEKYFPVQPSLRKTAQR